MEHPTIYQTLMQNPLWKQWVKHNEKTPMFDVHETIECGWMSDKHLTAFLEWVRNN